MYATIAGNIGSGKTSLTEIPVRKFGFTANYEKENSPCIGHFYEGMNRWSFNLPVCFPDKRLLRAFSMRRGNENILQYRPGKNK